MKVYLAAHYSRKLEVIKAARDLEDMGITVTSTWHNEKAKPNVSMKDVSKSFCRYIAKRDIKELQAADTFVLLSVDPDFKFTRGGHCFENGFAAALGMHLLVVGPRQLVFHYLPGVKRVDTWEQGKRWLKKQLLKDEKTYSYYYSHVYGLGGPLGHLHWTKLRPLPKASGKRKIRLFRFEKLGDKCPKATKRPRKTSKSSKKTS